MTLIQRPRTTARFHMRHRRARHRLIHPQHPRRRRNRHRHVRQHTRRCRQVRSQTCKNLHRAKLLAQAARVAAQVLISVGGVPPLRPTDDFAEQAAFGAGIRCTQRGRSEDLGDAWLGEGGHLASSSEGADEEGLHGLLVDVTRIGFLAVGLEEDVGGVGVGGGERRSGGEEAGGAGQPGGGGVGGVGDDRGAVEH